MILKSFILDNLVSLCMKIINSVVVVGLYYGFLTTFSIGPSYLFLLRARVMEEGTEKKVSATTGFITGQLMMFISIYYAPLHLALGRPHTITVIALPYLLFHFFCNNHKHFLNYGSTNQNSMRNFSIQRIFLNNLIFQLLNLFILPSSMLVRLVNIYMFRCNNQFLFLTSSFVGWLIGHILFMKWVGLVLVWIQQKNSIKSNVLIRSNKYIMSELRNFMSRIFIFFLFITSIYYLGRTPSPIFIKKLSEIQERGEVDNKIKIGVERTSKTKVTKQEQNKSTEEYLSPSIFSEERADSYKIDEREEKDIFRLEKPLLKILFNYKRFHHPLRYIKNDRFENAVRNEMSQFFFHTCQSDAKERISFTYPSSLSTFLEMMQRKTSLFTTEKLSYDELDNHWSPINKQKRKNLSKKFINRAEALDKEFLALDVLEKRIRLCNDKTKKKYLPKIYDPLLNGPYRGRIKKSFSLSIKNKTYTKNYIWINKIHGILLNINTNYPDFEQKMDTFDKKSLSTEIRFFFNLISKFSGKSVSSFNFKGLYLFPEHEKMDYEKKKKKKKKNKKKKKKIKKKKKAKKMDFCFLTVFGMEVELPFSSSPRNRLSFFDPIFKELKKKRKNWKKNLFLVLKVLKERTQFFLNVSKETAQWIIKNILNKILFLKEKIKKLSLSNLLFIFGLRKIYELDEIQKDSTISKSNPMIYESAIPIQSINWANCSLTEKKIKDLNDRTKTIIKQIEKFTKDKKKGFLISERNICSKKTTYDDKRLELQKNIWQILQRRNVRLARKSHYFFKFFMERVYIDIYVCIINIPRINVQLFLESTKNILNKYIYNNEANEERSDKKNKSLIHFISTIKKSICNISNMNSQNFCDVSSLSQAYVFYKLSQTQVINLYKYKLRSVFEYHGTPLFLKNEIKDSFFGIQGIFHSKLKHKNPPNSVMNQWTNWLKGHYQYDLSQSGWSRLVSQKWRNRMNERHVAQNKDLTKCHSYEKRILYKKQEVDSLTNPKNKIKKQYGYDLLSYKSINYADKKDSYIYGYRSPFQANNNQAASSNYNMRKKKLFDMTDDIPIKNYIVEDSILDMEKNLDRKYLDWRILNFCLRNKVDFGAWIDTDYYFTFHQEINPSNQKKTFFDWMGMNVEILNRSIANREFFFFSKFFIFYNAYTSNPWIIPIKLLFFNFNVNKNVSEKKNITEKKKIDIFRPSKKKKSLELELETRNQGKTEYAGQVNLEAYLSKKEKDVEEDYAGSDMKKGVKKNKYKNNIEVELNCFLRRYLLFQLNWRDCLNERIMNNIKVYCLLLRLINLKEIAIASIQRGELSLDIMKIQNQKDFTLTELNKNTKLMKKGILSIEPIRLSRKNHEQFSMYQTIGLSLIHKRKHQINQRYGEKSYVDKKTFDKSITRTKDQKLTENKEKNHYDLLVPENILSARRRRELRILICFNPRNRNSVHRNTAFYNENKVNNFCQVLTTSKDLDRDKKKLINLKLFLWPNYRLEDLACMNRYWFDTNNGSRFSMVRIHMYPRLKIR
uniref:Ycf1 n=1 Tax=Tachigali costaricensis TaxID=2723578 RepID=A0A6H0E855_9FABA|nr:Ycf1 [Tachigali costaricensis]QIS97598.1 Ycf1 [Tachigali costaricensis]